MARSMDQIGEAAQIRDEQEWKNEKLKLDHAGRLRGITSSILMTKITKKLSKHARRKLERPMAPAMPCKKKARTSITKVVAKHENDLQLYSGISGIHETTSGSSQPAIVRIIAGNDFTSMTRYSLVHKFIPLPQAIKIPGSKAAMDNEWKKLRTSPAWQLEKVKSKKEVILEAQRDKKKVHFASLMDGCHLKNAELEPKLQKNTKAESCSVVTL